MRLSKRQAGASASTTFTTRVAEWEGEAPAEPFGSDANIQVAHQEVRPPNRGRVQQRTSVATNTRLVQMPFVHMLKTCSEAWPALRLG